MNALWLCRRAAGLLPAVALALMLTGAPAPAAAPPKVRPAAQDFVFLAEARPVLVRVHAQIGDRPINAAWADFMKYLFAHLDVNGDGVLSKAEVERAPTLDQIRSGALAINLGRNKPPTLAELDLDKDGKASLTELAAYYEKKGLVPFQFEYDSGPVFSPQAAIFGGGRPEPTVQAVSDAIFARLDTNKDGKLTRKELEAALDVLMPLDEDEDEIITTREMVPHYKPRNNPFNLAAMMGKAVKGGKGALKLMVPVALPGEAPPDLVRFLHMRYGGKGRLPAAPKLTREQIGLDEATFRRLDRNGDGVLDSAELARFADRPPDLELRARLGGEKDTRLEVAGPKATPGSLAARLEVTGAVGLLDLGATRMELRGRPEEEGYDSLAGIIRQQILAQFKAADKDNKGYLDEKAANASRVFGGLFKQMDRDGDGKLTEKEVIAWLDHIAEMQNRATACCATLVLSDQSRGLFDLLDNNRDRQLSIREMRGAAGLLDRLDRTGKGYLTKKDIPRSYQLALRRGPELPDDPGGTRAFLALYRVSYKNEAGTGAGAGPLWFRKMDRNRDGDVSRKEWMFSEEKFREIDSNGDGLISAAEAQAYDARLRKRK
jgi:Ca2+-binding EF-hand superfamily protein